jgi:undecaprenyl-diphosphatase
MRRAEPRVLETVALGLLQGPAELLPVSSSAHVGLLPWLLGWRHAALPPAARKEVEVALHAGTAVTLALRRPPLRLSLLVCATAPPALAGFLFERTIETRLGTPPTVAVGLVAGAVAMVLADRTPSDREQPGIVDGLFLGIAQALALIPGISRSAATQAAARWRGFDRVEAAALSREVALPVLLGATVLKAARRPSRASLPALGLGAAAAAVSTWAALRLERAAPPLAAFAAYRVLIAGSILAVWHDRRR